MLQYGGVSGTPLAGMSFVQQETVADEGECVWPVGSDVEPILEWPTTIPAWGGDVSAAHVTGVAALLRGTRPDLSAADVRTRLLATAEKLPQFRGKCLSEGRLDAYRALAETTVVDPAAHQTALTIGVSSSAPAYGTKAAITGQVTQAGVPLRNVTVGLQELRAGVFEVVQVASTGETGQYRFEVSPSTSTVYRVTVRPIGHLTFAPSATRLVKPKTSISAPSAPSSVRRRSVFTVSGILRPRHPARATSVRVRCYRYESGRWVFRKGVNAINSDTADGHTRYRVRLTLPSAGRWRLVAYHADAGHSATLSGYRYIRVKR